MERVLRHGASLEDVRGSASTFSLFCILRRAPPRECDPILNFRIFSEVKEDDRREPQQPFGCEDSRREPDAEIGKKTKFIDLLREKIKEVKKNRKRVCII